MKNKTAPNHCISASCFIGDNTVIQNDYFCLSALRKTDCLRFVTRIERVPRTSQTHKVSTLCNYRPRSKGDNTFGNVRRSVRLFVCLSVCLFVRLSVYRITTRWSSQRAFKLVALSKCLRFQNDRALGDRSPF